MNRKVLANLLIVLVLILIMVGLNLLFYVDKREETENEGRADRSTYCGRTYGMLGYYTLLDEMHYPVGRWRNAYTELKEAADVKALFIIDPSPIFQPTKEEMKALNEWVKAGGMAVIVDRTVGLEFGGHQISTTPLPPPALFKTNSLELSKNEPGTIFPWQPVSYFRGVGKIGISDYASDLRWTKTKKVQKITPPPSHFPKKPEDSEEDADSDTADGGEDGDGTAFVPYAGRDKSVVFATVHYGSGMVVFLSDQFVLANNGITIADNVQFGLNLADSLVSEKTPQGDKRSRIMFDEYHHGYHNTGVTYTSLSGYFRGTPVPWVLWQMAVLTMLVIYTFGSRFARPIPMKRTNRASKLEYVSAMAQIQMVAESYDLAIENLYTRFHRALCRYGGVPTTITSERLAVAVARRAKRNPDEILALLRRCQEILNGKASTEHEMVQLAQKMRELESKLGLI